MRKAFFFVLTAHLATGQEIPDTAAGRQAAAFLEVFNRGDRDALDRHLREQFAAERRPDVDGLMRFRGMTGGFELKKIESATATDIAAIVKERDSDQFGRLTLAVEAAPPHRVTRFGVLAVPPPPGLEITRLGEKEAIDALGRHAAAAAARDAFAGAVLVARSGKIVFTGAWGLADREKKLPLKLDTRFNLGSMNKMFTAVAVARLAEQGKLRYTDTVGAHLGDYPQKEVAAKVTIHHLLTHTGGTGDIFGPQFGPNIEKLRNPADYLALYGSRAPAFEPGARFAYSNYGFVLLGAIIEQVTGKSYYDAIRELVYVPAGMKRSDSFWKNEDTPNLAKGYTGPERKDNYDSRPMRGSPAGGGYSTVEDLERFAAAVLTGRLVKPETVALLTTAKGDRQDGAGYGYGFGESLTGGVRGFGHGGGAPGINAELMIMPASGYVVAAMSNLDPPAATRVVRFVAARLPAR